MPFNTRCLFTILASTVAIGLFVAACGGTSDSDKTATAAPSVTATAEAAMEATAQARAHVEATALRSLAAENETVGFYLAVYQSLSDEVKGRLDVAGIDEARFATSLGTLGPDSEPDGDAIAEVFGAIGDLEVTFVPSEAIGSLIDSDLLQAARVAVDEETAASIRSGDTFLTGSQLARLFYAARRFVGIDDDAPSPITGIDTEEVVAFFASLPDDVKQELEAGGWPEERIVAFIGEADDGIEAIPPVEELRNLLLPLSDTPVPPLEAQMQALLGLLDALPSGVTAPLSLQLGQGTINELKAGARPPTGREFLTLIEFALRLAG